MVITTDEVTGEKSIQRLTPISSDTELYAACSNDCHRQGREDEEMRECIEELRVIESHRKHHHSLIRVVREWRNLDTLAVVALNDAASNASSTTLMEEPAPNIRCSARRP